MMVILWLLEAWVLPDAIGEVAFHAGDIRLRVVAVPAPGKPAPDAAPGVASDVGLAGLDIIIQPALVAFIARAPDPIGCIGVEGGRGVDARPGRLLVWIAVLQNAKALGALAGCAVATYPM